MNVLAGYTDGSFLVLLRAHVNVTLNQLPALGVTVVLIPPREPLKSNYSSEGTHVSHCGV